MLDFQHLESFLAEAVRRLPGVQLSVFEFFLKVEKDREFSLNAPPRKDEEQNE